MVRVGDAGRARVVVGGQLPPPRSGQHVAVQRILDRLDEDPRLDVEHLPYRFAGTMTDQGRVTPVKVAALLVLVVRVLALRRHGPVDVFLHPISGPATGAAIKDAVLLLAARLACRHVVLQFHGGGHAVAWARPSRLQWALARVLGTADLGVVHARLHERDPRHLGIDRVAVVPHRVPDRYDPDLRVPAGDGTVRVLYVGHLGPHRGTDALVRATARLHADGVPLRLTLVGSPAQGWQPADLDALLGQVDPEVVTAVGELSGARLDAAFASADVFTFPSLFVAESFGLVLVEALMWGLPVVATDWRAAAEVLDGPGLDVIVHPTGPSLEEEVTTALGAMVRRLERGEVVVPSMPNRRWYERSYRDDVFPLADVIVELVGAG